MVLVTSFPTAFSHNKYGASASGFWAAVARRTMATEEATPGSQSEESNALDLPSAFDLRDYVLQRPNQEVNSEAFSSVEAPSFPCSSDVDPGSALSFRQSLDGQQDFLQKALLQQSRQMAFLRVVTSALPPPRP
ncbi:shieldin complex subunit 1 isoform X5 [Manis javanica]|uniref:shieldin complex subunit 1 isoform X5 n=1 Tax=Manis javanica TaxID=9974 RepID=UPI003C6D6A2D